MNQDLIITKKITIDAPAAKIWEALTNPEITKKYFFGCEIISDWLVGSRISFIEKKEDKEIEHVRGNILILEKEKCLQFTVWSEQSGLADVEENYSHVKFELNEKNGITTVYLTQDNFKGNEKGYNDSLSGWDYVLNGLKQTVEM